MEHEGIERSSPQPSPAQARKAMRSAMTTVTLASKRGAAEGGESPSSKGQVGHISAEDRAELEAHQKEWDGEFQNSVHSSMEGHEEWAIHQEHMELEARGFIKSDMQLTLKIVLRGPAGDELFLMDIFESIRYKELRSAVKARLGDRLSGELVMLWLTQSGGTVELNDKLFRLYVVSNWCSQPWTIYVWDCANGPLTPIMQTETARVLFQRYDINMNGRVEKKELLRLFKDLSLDELNCSDELMEGFIESEFKRLDADSSEGLTPDEFARYITSMTQWMRQELMVVSNAHNIFALLASRAVEVEMGPVQIPPAFGDTDTSDVCLEDGVWVASLPKFGIKVEIPSESLIEGAKFSMQTLSTSAISYLKEGGAQRMGEFPFTPAVRVDYPAFDDERRIPEVGDTAATPKFEQPLTLRLPHCFDPKDGEESCVFLGAPHGAVEWQKVHATDLGSSATRDDLSFCGGELRATIPYAGIFCGFSNPDVEDVAATRFHIFTLDAVPRDDPSSLRVHLCPDLPHEYEEMVLAECAEWGSATCVGSSSTMFLCQGARLRLRYKDDRTGEEQESAVTWMGARCSAEFTIPVSGDKGEEPGEEDPDDREILRDTITVDVIPGIGSRASRTNAVAKRAGIPEAGYEVPFVTRLQNEVRPHAPVLTLMERTPYNFTVVWTRPRAIDGDGDGDVSAITHYSLELATTAPSGTYYPWKELWSGAGHAAPDFQSLAVMTLAQKVGDPEVVKDAKAEVRQRKAKLEQAMELSVEEFNGLPWSTHTEVFRPQRKSKRKSRPRPTTSDATREAIKQEEEENGPIYMYTLEVDPELFGRLRIRCWAEGEPRPSRQSNVVKVPRWVGEDDKKGMDALQHQVEKERKEYFQKRTQHITDGKPVHYRIGNAASLNSWGGDPMPPPPPNHDRETAHIVMAPVPYDVPRLPLQSIHGLAEAGEELAAFYREMGVVGGGGGLLFGMRIDHVLHGIMGTPTVFYKYSPRRTVATLHEPLVALCELAYADVLLPLVDTAAVCEAEWGYVEEKICGAVAQITLHTRHYPVLRGHLREILSVLLDFYEMLRQCQEEQSIQWHLTHLDYTAELKRKLEAELTAKMCEKLWKLSTELLEMQLELRNHEHHCACPRQVPWHSPQTKIYEPPARRLRKATVDAEEEELVPVVADSRFMEAGYRTAEEDALDKIHAHRIRSQFAGPGGGNGIPQRPRTALYREKGRSKWVPHASWERPGSQPAASLGAWTAARVNQRHDLQLPPISQDGSSHQATTSQARPLKSLATPQVSDREPPKSATPDTATLASAAPHEPRSPRSLRPVSARSPRFANTLRRSKAHQALVAPSVKLDALVRVAGPHRVEGRHAVHPRHAHGEEGRQSFAAVDFAARGESHGFDTEIPIVTGFLTPR